MDTGFIRTVLAAVPLPMVLVGADERLAAANAPAEDLLGAAMIGRHHAIAMRQPGLVAAVEAARLRGEAGQVRHIIPGGAHDVVYRVTVTPVALADGRGALCAFEDISEHEQIGQMRRDFVANVSHELRTPLTALMGFIETLRGPARDDAAARDRFLAIMEREAGRMNRLVQDLLSLSRVEAEERQRPTERIDIVALLTSAVTALRPMAETSGVVIEVASARGPIVLPADPDQLTQVFHNLIENAVKYGGAGKSVTVSVTALDRDPDLRGPAVRIDVIDRGEGIEAVHLPRLTERFYRVDSHRSREKGGTGLGLAIVKHIVHRHRGRMQIDSQRGKGSRFSVILPRD